MSQDHKTTLFGATLTPNRSLSKRGYTIIMGFFILYFLTLMLIFLNYGWWPIIGFCGLELIALWLAFKISFFRTNSYERVEVSKETIIIRKVSPKGIEVKYEFHPMWSRLVYKIGMEDDHLDHLFVQSKGEKVEIASMLSHKERYDFYKALKTALSGVGALSPLPA